MPAGSFSFRSCGAHVLRKIAKSLRVLKPDHQLNGFVRFVDLCLNDRVAENVSHRFDGCLGDTTIVASMICPLMADTDLSAQERAVSGGWTDRVRFDCAAVLQVSLSGHGGRQCDVQLLQ
jgi:hypothetical protein